MEKVLDKLSNFCIDAAGNIIFALVVIIVGFKLTGFVVKLLQKGKGFNKLEKSVQTFLSSFLTIAFKTIILITAVSILGVPMTSIITVIGSFGLALGLALQGGLSNIAGSLMILIFKPFKVGDYIETDSMSGIVQEISMFYTVLKTIDDRKVILPNGNLSNSNLINYKNEIILKYTTSYKSDIDKVEKVLKELVDSCEYITSKNEVSISLSKYEDSDLLFSVRINGVKDKYYTIMKYMNENVKKAFDKNKIEIPFPQLDVHLDK